jgi:hypothetical protein
MKNILKLIGITALVAVFGLSMLACGNNDDASSGGAGTLTITNISTAGWPTGTYYVYGEASDFIFAASKPDLLTAFQGALVPASSGSVTLNVYLTDGYDIVPFTRNVTIPANGLRFYVGTNEIFYGVNWGDWGMFTNTLPVVITNGTATISFATLD